MIHHLAQLLSVRRDTESVSLKVKKVKEKPVCASASNRRKNMGERRRKGVLRVQCYLVEVGLLIRIAFVDVDDTLLDFRESARISALKAAQTENIHLPQTFMQTFERINDVFWHRIEEGTMTREELHQVRWTAILRELGVAGNGIRMEQRFRENLRNTAVPVEGAHEMLSFLAERVPVWIASNAVRQQQEKRLGLAGMRPFVQGILASVDLGANKPSPAFFRACLERVGPVLPEECLMIGDSMRADIAGAARAGMRTCWYHPSLEPEEDSGAVRPDWTVRNLKEIMMIEELKELRKERHDDASSAQRME